MIDRIVGKIKKVASFGRVVIAFSGGEDSALVSRLASLALGTENVELVHVCFGPYGYSKGLENAIAVASELGLALKIVPGRTVQERILRNGPACNMCTRVAKLGVVKAYAGGRLVLSGANRSDTWGQMGLELHNGVYSPLFELEKDEIREMLESLQLEVPRIGESSYREGCKLKHLLKPLVNPNYHGHAAAVANEVLLDTLDEVGWRVRIANVKIVGPLSKNVGLVNVDPIPPKAVKKLVLERLSRVRTLDEVLWVEGKIKLKVMANPGLFSDTNARYWVGEGRIGRDFAEEVELEWHRSSNKRLRTFHVVEAIEAGRIAV